MCFCGLWAAAQSVAPRRLITEKVNENQLVPLKGNVPPAAQARNDAGRVSPGLKMTDMTMVLRRSPEQQAAFDAFVASQYDSGSPNFHHWLEPNEVGEKFGPALEDIATISNWLQSQGLSVDGISKDRMTIRFSGSAAQVEAAFHTEIHNLVVKGKQHISNMSDPQIPMALEPAVVGPKGLNSFVPRPLHRVGGTAKLNSETGKWERSGDLTQAKGILRPEMALSCGTQCQLEDLTPYDFATIYNVLPLWTASTPIDGTGQTIAIAGTSDVRTADVAAFRSTFGLPAGPTLQTIVANGTDPGYCGSTTNTTCKSIEDQIENALDVEWSGAVAPKAQIVLVVSGANSQTTDTVGTSAQYVVDHKTAPVLNVSYGLCELFMGTAGNTSYNTMWQSAAAEGIAVFVASGDSGSPNCDQGGDSGGTPYAAQWGLSVSGLASTPYNTAVGGTDLNWSANTSNYWNTTNSSTNGSNAKGYMPEVPWNSTCTNPLALSYLQSWATELKKAGFSATSPTDAESACNFVQTWWQTIKQGTNPAQDISWLVDSVGAGGGASNCTANNTTSTTADPASCSGGYAKPSWQSGVSGIPTDGKRDIPDVSFFASPGFLGSAYLICISDWSVQNGTSCITKSATTAPAASEIGGTSASSPAMAGVMALINQKAGSAQGSPNAELYQIAAKQNYANCSTESGTVSNGCYFNDIDTGTSGTGTQWAGTIEMACAKGSPNCNIANSSDAIGILSGYSGAVGFDLATGLGSLNVANVVNAWTASVGTGSATVTVTPASSSIVSNQSLSVTVAVAGASGTPTGSVVLAGGGYTSSPQTLSSGSTTFSIPANSLAAGTDTLTANYGGDPTYAAASGTANVTVTQFVGATSTVAVTANPNSITTAQGTAVTVAVTGASGTPTGTVTLTSGSFTSASHTLDATGSTTFNLSPGVLAAGIDTITAKYSGDNVYAAATGTVQVTVTQATYKLAATTPAAITRGSSATSTVTVSTSNGYAGSVALTCTLTTGPAGATNQPTCSVTGSPVTLSSTATSVNATATVSTTAATATMQKPRIGGWAEGGGAVLALIVLLGIPARRRGWRAMLGMIVLMLALGSFSACGGGGGGSNGGGGGGSPGTTSGDYTFTVTGTGTPALSPAPTTTFIVHVN